MSNEVINPMVVDNISVLDGFPGEAILWLLLLGGIWVWTEYKRRR